MTAIDALALEARIDALFARWNRPGSPGAVIGIARAGEIVLAKGYGMASLEHAVPITPATRFRIASVTKQFVCAAALMLADEGRLDLAARPSRYLPALPDLPVGIDQMMRNTSGLPDFLELLRLGGAALDDPASAGDIDAAVARNRHLNFEPGSRFLYSNTNFLLLGRIIETIEGRPLAEVLRARLFAPLGMAATELTPDIDAVVPGLAGGYLDGPGGGFRRAAHAFPLAGEGGLVSSLQDLLIWSRHFERPRLGPAGLVNRLMEQAPLTGGASSAYARGIEHGSLRGLGCLGHGGLWPGYRTEFLRLPAANLTVVVIANLVSVDPFILARAAAVEALAGEGILQPAPPPPDLAPLEAAAGTYASAEELSLFTLDVVEGRPRVTQGGIPFWLAPREDGWLAAERGSFEFALKPPSGGETLQVAPGAGRTVSFTRLAGRPAPPADLAGTYVSADTGATWVIRREGEAMTLSASGPLRAGRPPGPVRGVTGDVVEVEVPSNWLPSIGIARIEREGAHVSGLTVSTGRIKRLRFERIAA